ncbi:MAG: TIGR02466 family protein [Wenzhouxiangellaceae bacterium]
MTKSKGEVRPLFPAGAVGRYVNAAHQSVQLDGLSFEANYGSGTESTDTEINILDEPRFAALAEFLRGCIKDFLDNVLCYQYQSFSIVHAWVNKAPEGGWQRMHFHGNSIISGVYYLQAERENAPLVFEKVEINTSPYLAVVPRKNTPYNANRMAFPAESGVCYLFPSQIKHGYDMPNKGAERISLAFNVILRGIGESYSI